MWVANLYMVDKIMPIHPSLKKILRPCAMYDIENIIINIRKIDVKGFD